MDPFNPYTELFRREIVLLSHLPQWIALIACIILTGAVLYLFGRLRSKADLSATVTAINQLRLDLDLHKMTRHSRRQKKEKAALEGCGSYAVEGEENGK